jgi:pentose-5-phosphate-3-epimerase
MSTQSTAPPAWVIRGKTIRQLVKELQSFENQDLFVEISVDGGDTHKPISLVKKSGQLCLLVNSEI